MPDVVDYVIVGAGSSGCVLGNRLSARPDVSVLVLEAGPTDTAAALHIPAAFSRLFRSPLDWSYDTVPQPALAGRSIYWPRGKVLGGSSSINAMMWVRGYAADYDGWARLAGAGWGYEQLARYFRRIDDALHIETQRSPREHTARFLAAVEQLGLPRAEVNSAAARRIRADAGESAPRQALLGRGRLPEAGAAPQQPHRAHRGTGDPSAL